MAGHQRGKVGVGQVREVLEGHQGRIGAHQGRVAVPLRCNKHQHLGAKGSLLVMLLTLGSLWVVFGLYGSMPV